MRILYSVYAANQRIFLYFLLIVFVLHEKCTQNVLNRAAPMHLYLHDCYALLTLPQDTSCNQSFLRLLWNTTPAPAAATKPTQTMTPMPTAASSEWSDGADGCTLIGCTS